MQLQSSIYETADYARLDDWRWFVGGAYVILRASIDALFVTAGVWVAEAWSHKTEKASAMKQLTV